MYNHDAQFRYNKGDVLRASSWRSQIGATSRELWEAAPTTTRALRRAMMTSEQQPG
jgi:hypothetical protein